MKIVEPKKMKMLPARPGTCVMCATAHPEHAPHNWWSLFYQTRFQLKWDRGATHADCVAHLCDDMQRRYRAVLAEHGIAWSEPATGIPVIREPYAMSER